MSGRAVELDPASVGSLLEFAHDAILVRDPEGRIGFWNAGAEALYGWSEAEVLGRTSHELLATEFPCRLAEIERMLEQHGSWEGELRHRTRAGDEVVVESRWAAERDADGALVAVLEVNRDVTARIVAEREVAAEAERFRALFEASLDAILLTTPDGRILAANPAAEAMCGRTEAEIVAGGRRVIIDESDPRLTAALREREKTGRFRGDMRALRRDGTPFEVEVSSVLFHDAAGELRTSIVMRNVTERVQALESARESEARFRALADAAFEGVFIHAEGLILDANRAACTMLGYTEQELKGMRVLDLAVPQERERVRARIEAGGADSYETQVLTAQGETLLVEVSRRAITFEGKPAQVVAIRDITEREQARQALQAQNERLRELDLLKSEFVALVSHELRTPLTSIIAHLDVLEAGEPGRVNERQRRYLEVARKNAKRLQRLVDDLLLVARADAGQFTLVRRPIELAPVAEEVVEALRDAAAEAGVRLGLRRRASPVVEADRDRIVQLLDNLVWNAIHATSRGGSVEVEVEMTDREATIAVSDTGVGISMEEQQQLFNRFYRTRPTATGAPAGAGLGLAIVKEIVDAHHGTITIDSALDRGSTFTVHLPLPH